MFVQSLFERQHSSVAMLYSVFAQSVQDFSRYEYQMKTKLRQYFVNVTRKRVDLFHEVFRQNLK